MRASAPQARPKWAPRHKHTLLATKTGQLLLFGGNDFGPTRGFYALDAAASLAALAAQAAAPTGMRALLALEVPVSLAIPRCCQCGQPPSDSQPMHPLPRRAPALSLHPCASQACALFWRGRWPSCSCSAYSSSLSRHGRVASASSTFREHHVAARPRDERHSSACPAHLSGPAAPAHQRVDRALQWAGELPPPFSSASHV